ncbi:uncharacterized protein BJ212DRAFT_996373 [Suillus subaureus]|uniref:Uncharacterized protein n=1 Tax=Suillus subaureus TaxID=48587 RepID=A0A9P7DTI6_9AGAM|nr:uncharacterized protein BJ212DRAFT_996373 [Suillus subaureus]KAG1802541.1 hypothetical protein BJ212DRAFT_996373 [Suillus subaureus]
MCPVSESIHSRLAHHLDSSTLTTQSKCALSRLDVPQPPIIASASPCPSQKWGKTRSAVPISMTADRELWKSVGIFELKRVIWRLLVSRRAYFGQYRRARHCELYMRQLAYRILILTEDDFGLCMLMLLEIRRKSLLGSSVTRGQHPLVENCKVLLTRATNVNTCRRRCTDERDRLYTGILVRRKLGTCSESVLPGSYRSPNRSQLYQTSHEFHSVQAPYPR